MLDPKTWVPPGSEDELSDAARIEELAALIGIPAATLRGLREKRLVAVPREPTDAMWDAARAQLSAGEGVLAIWRAMLAAAQEPQHDR